MPNTDRHAAGPFSRVWFFIDRDGRLSTFTHMRRELREECAGTQIDVLSAGLGLRDTRWLGRS